MGAAAAAGAATGAPAATEAAAAAATTTAARGDNLEGVAFAASLWRDNQTIKALCSAAEYTGKG